MRGFIWTLGLLATLGGLACQKRDHKQKEIFATPTEQLKVKFAQKNQEALVRRTPDGWLETAHCDAMLFTGKYMCVSHVSGVNLRAAEYPEQPGRFNRRPDPFCEAGGHGSATSWSRDMGMGLLSGAWCTKDLGILQDHAAYGSANYWKMGEPLADGRVVYTPAMIGKLYELIYVLGGEDNAARTWPNVYPEGLDDYEAHLQMLDIWLRGEVAAAHPEVALVMPKKPKKSPEPQGEGEFRAALIDVSAAMYERIKEHAAREPMCPFYQYLWALYDTGDMAPVVSLLLGNEGMCQYWRGNAEDDLALVEWLFATSLVLKKVD